MPLGLLATTFLILGLLIQPLQLGAAQASPTCPVRHEMDPRRHVPHGVG